MLKKESALRLLVLAAISLRILVASIPITNQAIINIGLGARIPGDCNGVDGVNIQDFQLLSNTFGKTIGQTGYDGRCDFNGSNSVDILDFQILSNHYGNTTTSPSRDPTSLSSCLSLTGPLITLSGSKTKYSNNSLTDSTKIDATNATFINGGQVPVKFGGGTNLCWHSGRIYGGYPLNASWDTTHPTAGIMVTDNSPGFKIEGAYIDQIGDGIKIRLGENSGQAGISIPFTISGVWLRDIRDDCVESDWQAGGLLNDNLFDGCYVLFATERRSGVVTDGSNNTWEIRNTLAYMHDQLGVYKGPVPGHSMFFKWDSTSPKIRIYNSIFRADSANTETSADKQFAFPPDKLIDCANNTLVWLGPRPFPWKHTLPSCFSVTYDKSVWDSAVTDWKIRHGYYP